MSLETSLWFALLALIVGYFLLRIAIGLLMRLIRTGAGVAAWQQNRRARVAQARTVRGLLLAGEGDWAGARKALAADAETVDLPLVNYLGAARAANEIGDAADRDALLQKASESTPGATLAVGLTQAELQIAAQQYSGRAQRCWLKATPRASSAACCAAGGMSRTTERLERAAGACAGAAEGAAHRAGDAAGRVCSAGRSRGSESGGERRRSL